MHLSLQFCFALFYTCSRDAGFLSQNVWFVLVCTPRSVTEYRYLVTFRSGIYLELDSKFGRVIGFHSKTYGKHLIEVFEERYKLRTVCILLLRRDEESHSFQGVGTGQVFSQSMTESIKHYSYSDVVRLCLA